MKVLPIVTTTGESFLVEVGDIWQYRWGDEPNAEVNFVLILRISYDRYNIHMPHVTAKVLNLTDNNVEDWEFRNDLASRYNPWTLISRIKNANE